MKLRNYWVVKLRNYWVVKLINYWIVKLRNYWVVKLTYYWVAGLHKIFFVLYPKKFKVKMSYRARTFKYFKCVNSKYIMSYVF